MTKRLKGSINATRAPNLPHGQQDPPLSGEDVSPDALNGLIQPESSGMAGLVVFVDFFGFMKVKR